MRLLLALIVASLTLLGTVGCGGSNSNTDTAAKKAVTNPKMIGNPNDLGVKTSSPPGATKK